MVYHNSSNRLNSLKFLFPAILALALVSHLVAQSPDRDERRVVCSSDGGRVFCDADTRGGVRLTRQFQDSGACVQGESWGYNDRAIWVDRGCAGEFALVRGPRASTTIEPGTEITVRTNQKIDADRRDNRVYNAFDRDVFGADGRVAIPRGSPVELIVREAPDRDLILDLESVNVNGNRYAIAAGSERIEAHRGPGVGENRSTAEHVGGGAVLGAIIGAIAGGGKGAAIGAGAGAAAGAGEQMITRGRSVNVPAESLITFRMQQPLVVGVPDYGVNRDGVHYHEDHEPER